MSTIDGGAAFPSGDGECAGSPAHERGMSLRDYFAGQAMNGFISNSTTKAQPGSSELAACSEIARVAYLLADCMLAARQTSDRA